MYNILVAVNVFCILLTVIFYIIQRTSCKLTTWSRAAQHHNKAVIYRRLRPRVATAEVTLSTRKVVPCVCWPATGITAHIYSQAQGCVCTALQLGGDVEQPCLWANMASSIKPEVHNVSLRLQGRTEPRPWVTCKKLVKIGRVVLKIWSRTYTLITTLRSPIGGEVIRPAYYAWRKVGHNQQKRQYNAEYSKNVKAQKWDKMRVSMQRNCNLLVQSTSLLISNTTPRRIRRR